ncbi:MAG: Calx-beta domain-containing protein [Bacteroidota bacterium]|nr:Calx-beta domain-containing protein [Bacteroidota bacterium]
MKKIYKLNYVVLMALIVFLSGCEKKEYTDYSTLVPTSPTVTISGIDAGGYNFVEQDTTFTFDVTISEAQVADVSLYIKQIDGNATSGDDYKINNSSSKVTIAATATTGTVSISILPDDLIEDVETLTLQIGDERTANATFSPATVTFTIGNLTGSAFTADLSWDTDVEAVVGLALDPTEAVDLRMLIYDVAGDSLVAVEDGGSFESFAGFNTLIDGDYKIAVDIFSTINAGDFDGPLTLDLALEFNQPGVINGQTMSFPAVMTNVYVCETYRVYLADITKAGDDYTMTEAIAVPEHFLSGVWYGIDVDDTTGGYHQYPSEVVAELGCTFQIKGLGFGWMANFWGEEIIAGGSATMTIDEVNDSVFIADQYYMTTLYNGEVQDDYTIVGKGTFDNSGAYPTMTIEYEMTNFGMGWAQWCFDNGYMASNKFVANLTQDPDGKWSTSSIKPAGLQKPNR